MAVRLPAALRSLLRLAPPTLLALHGPLALLAANLGVVEPSSAARSLLISALFGILVTLAALAFLRKQEAAVVLAGVFILLFFAYGHAYDWIRAQAVWANEVARHRYLAPAAAILALGVGGIAYRQPRLAAPLFTWITVIGWALVALSMGRILQAQLPSWGKEGRAWAASSAQAIQDTDLSLPDIYYIILDGYGREDVLRQLYGYDNAEFIHWLESKGFQVGQDSMSNYSQTGLSLASSLNMIYLDDLAAKMGPESYDRGPLSDLVEGNEVFALARSFGYRLVVFDSGIPYTQFREAEVYFEPDYQALDEQRSSLYPTLALNQFEGLLLETSLTKAILDPYRRGLWQQAPGVFDADYRRQRERVLFALSNLSEVADFAEPTLAFAHIVSPHPPFVFGSQGEEVLQDVPYHLGATDDYYPTDEYVERYKSQIEYVTRLVQVEIGELLDASERPPIIVVQGDHGPSGHVDWNHPDESGLRERMSILNAYHLPGPDAPAVRPEMSPVNSFRLIFDAYLGTTFGELPDISYFSTYPRPYRFTVVEPSDR